MSTDAHTRHARFSHMESTQARARDCDRCKAPILEAYDEGLLVQVDALALNGAPGEVAALMAGRHTYTYTFSKQLVQRTAERIAGGWLRGPVHGEHRCGERPQQEALF